MKIPEPTVMPEPPAPVEPETALDERGWWKFAQELKNTNHQLKKQRDMIFKEFVHAHKRWETEQKDLQSKMQFYRHLLRKISNVAHEEYHPL